MDTTQCGNDNHPNGAWHEAEALPYSWQHIQNFRRWWRQRKYGCACPVKENK